MTDKEINKEIEDKSKNYIKRAEIFLKADEKNQAKRLLLKANKLKPNDRKIKNLLERCK